ncbi:AAA domain-containing protein [Rhodovulum sp. DZ06]|uniref:AAA domain-containing protein n=1 Tax=Rhodovulum sp. DZ06 TaxID=3425126 RepID=UPI003D33B2DE
MSPTLRVIRAFPSGKRTAELLRLMDQDFDPLARRQVLAELDELVELGLVRRSRDGRWLPVTAPRRPGDAGPGGGEGATDPGAAERLSAVQAEILRVPLPDAADDAPVAAAEPPAPPLRALIAYYQAALRDDPRGSTTVPPEDHGAAWQLVHGAGRFVPDAGRGVQLRIHTERLGPEFRKALLRREGGERSLALGWPIALGERSGAPAIWPVGLLPATWRRAGEMIEVTVETDAVFANPDWLRDAARGLGWSQADLRERLEGTEGVGLPFEEFRDILREAASGALRGRLDPERLAPSLPLSAPGLHDMAALFLPTESSFTQGVVRDLGAIADWDDETLAGTALGGLLGAGDAPGAARPAPAINLGPLNAEQLDALHSALSAPLTVVSGPPGTGKSQVIVAMAASELAAGRSVLVGSKNHQALDAVEERLGGLAENVAFMVRTLDPAKKVDVSLSAVLQELTMAPGRAAPPPDAAVGRALQALSQRRRDGLGARRREEARRCDMADLLERIEALPEAEEEPPVQEPPRGLLARLLAWLRGAPAAMPAPVDARQRLQDELDALRALPPETWDDPVELGDAIAEKAREALPRFLAARAAMKEEDRLSLADAWGAHELSGRRGHPPAELARQTIAHRPLWLASLLGAPKRIPLAPALFDLVIIDEASQCDIASALPLFARARRAVIVGDRNQLSFISQLGLAHDRNLMETHGLAPATMSRYAQSRQALFDLARAAPGAAAAMLRDQYRSAPGIVDYLNQEFYQGGLRPAVDMGRLKTPKGQKPGIAWTHVPAPSVPGKDNPAEARAVAAHLHELLEVQGYDGSVGVISPFRAQVAALTEAVGKQVSPEAAARADLRVATVDSFQGQERDLVLFSPCIGPASPMSQTSFLSRDWRRLNVAISRARAVAHVFGDQAFARSGKVRALARLAAFATEPPRPASAGLFDSEWERRVFHALKARGLEPHPQHFIAGRRLDFALFGEGGVKLDLEVDGRRWHMTADGRRKTSDLWRDHQLRSLGWKVRRFWVDELNDDMEGCLDIVERDLRA